MQRAPGYDFSLQDGALATRIGDFGAEARVSLAGGQVSIAAHDSFVLTVRTTSVGRRSAQHEAPHLEASRAEGQEVVLQRAGMEERYLAGPLGLEQSYRIDARPVGTGELTIETRFEGLEPELAGDASDVVRLRDRAGRARAFYRGLAAIDSRGSELAARMQVAGNAVQLVIDDSEAAYPISVDPLVVVQQAKLTASDGVADDSLGGSVSISGKTAIVGKSDVSMHTGAAYVFVRSGNTWTEQAKLTPSGAIDGSFGDTVSISGETAIVGAYLQGVIGAAYVFVRNGNTWSQQAKLSPPDAGMFGSAVSIEGDTALIGAYSTDNAAGAAYVFVRNGTNWSQQAKLTASDGVANQKFGTAAGLSGDTAVVSVAFKGAYVFVRNGTNWYQQAKLTPNDPLAEYFAYSVAVSGDRTIVGAPWTDGDSGAAYVFERVGTTWTQHAKLTAADGDDSDRFGHAVAISGDTAVVGARTKGAGAAYVFKRDATNWTEQAKLTASDGMDGDQFGYAVCLSSNTVVVGAIGADSTVGAAYVFLLGQGQQGDPCNVGADCNSTYCVDGVCCADGCGGGNPLDCLACSQSAGAAADGICGPVTCTASDACHEAGTCDPTSGCPNLVKADGTGCNDGSACTQLDTCQAGVCTGSTPVTCTALDACHDVGSCAPSTGQCSNPAKPDGAPCPGGMCQSGVCTSQDAGAGGAGVGGAGAGGASTGGTAGSGASAGVGGSSGKAGAAGTAGPQTGGSAGAAGAAAEPGSDTSGCGCRTPDRSNGSNGAMVVAAIAISVIRRRRAARQ
ncbi:MAG: FG-GAP repeat protein [Deltaproteobacteria bacterium]|nr:FG-GAP repeat protein [Deltaproteobacteria bacterium]